MNIIISFGFSLLVAFFMTFMFTFLLAAFHPLGKLYEFQFHLAYLIPIIFTVIFVLSFFILTHHVVREIMSLESAIQVISEGNLNHRVPPMLLIELRGFSFQVNSMVEYLQEQMIKEREEEISKREWIEKITNELHKPLADIIQT